jgi:hypothetical protein
VSLSLSSTYQWLDCGNNFAPISNANSRTFVPGKSGVYAVEVIKNGCIDTSECLTFMTSGLSKAMFPSVKVFPIPATNHIEIDWPYMGGDRRTIVVVDSRGRVLKLIAADPSQKIVRLSTKDLARGIYFLRLEQAGMLWTRRIILN